MPRFNLDDYIDVAERIETFYEKYPNGRIHTQLLNVRDWNGKQDQFIVHAFLYDGDQLLSTGLAEESFGPSGPNQTSALENAETSAIGRAAANLNLATTRSGQRQRASRQEMEKVNRASEPAYDPARVALRDTLRSQLETPEFRKMFILGVIGREVNTYNDLTEAEVTQLNEALAQKGNE